MESRVSVRKSCGSVRNQSCTRDSVGQSWTTTRHTSHVPSWRGGGPSMGSHSRWRRGIPVLYPRSVMNFQEPSASRTNAGSGAVELKDRKSTRLNSSHHVISYAVFCLKKIKNLPHLSHVISV